MPCPDRCLRSGLFFVRMILWTGMTAADAARMEVLVDDDPEYRECDFLMRALANGCLVTMSRQTSSMVKCTTGPTSS